MKTTIDHKGINTAPGEPGLEVNGTFHVNGQDITTLSETLSEMARTVERLQEIDAAFDKLVKEMEAFAARLSARADKLEKQQGKLSPSTKQPTTKAATVPTDVVAIK